MATKQQSRKRTPAMSPEAAERHCIDAAYSLAQRQLDDGSASPSVITHFLKMGTEQARLEREKLERETELLKTKNEAINDSKRIEELYANAINAMRTYSGQRSESEEDKEPLYYVQLLP